jgi:two-component system sensor histidine kinase YesM
MKLTIGKLRRAGMNIKKTLISRYRSTEIGKKLLAILLTVSFLQIGIVMLISNYLSADIITKQTRQLLEESLERSAGNIRYSFEQYNSVIQTICTDASYIDDLKVINSWDGEVSYLSRHSLSDKLRDLTYLNEDIIGIALIGRYGDECYYDAVTNSSQTSYCFPENLRNMNPVQEAIAQKDSVYSASLSPEDDTYESRPLIYIAHQITDFNNYKKGVIGCVVLCIDENQFRKVYSQGTETSNLSVLVDQYGNIISIPLTGYQGRNLSETQPEDLKMPRTLDTLKNQAYQFINETHYFNGTNLAVNAVSIHDNEFFIINIQDLNYSLKNLRYLTLTIVLVAMLAGVFCFVIVYYISIDTDASVKKILRAMNEANKGNLYSRIETEGTDEFAKISENFNVMLAEIKKSRDQEREFLVREKNAEIRSLEAQINPHFLYNTLDTINWMAIEEKQFSISQMITRLAQILRYSIHNSNEIVTIRTELDFLKKYIYLQQQRFDYSFDCTMEVDEGVMEYRIHKLLLQPLLENTILHGFSGIDYMGEVQIRIEQQEPDRIQIEVSDNGVGMSEEMLEQLNHYDYKTSRIETSIGVRNVITRIKLYYGEQGEIHFFSDSHGTTVRIVIPAEQEADR